MSLDVFTEMHWFSGFQFLKEISGSGFPKLMLSGWSVLRVFWENLLFFSGAFKDGPCCCQDGWVQTFLHTGSLVDTL